MSLRGRAGPRSRDLPAPAPSGAPCAPTPGGGRARGCRARAALSGRDARDHFRRRQTDHDPHPDRSSSVDTRTVGQPTGPRVRGQKRRSPEPGTRLVLLDGHGRGRGRVRAPSAVGGAWSSARPAARGRGAPSPASAPARPRSRPAGVDVVVGLAAHRRGLARAARSTSSSACSRALAQRPRSRRPSAAARHAPLGEALGLPAAGVDDARPWQRGDPVGLGQRPSRIGALERVEPPPAARARFTMHRRRHRHRPGLVDEPPQLAPSGRGRSSAVLAPALGETGREPLEHVGGHQRRRRRRRRSRPP